MHIVVKYRYIVYVYACRGLGPKAVNKKNIYHAVKSLI